MIFFENYTSNTIGGSSNQFVFNTEGKVSTGRVFYKIRMAANFIIRFYFQI